MREITIIPSVFDSQDRAEATAWAKSIFDDCYYYILRKTTGEYVVDYMGIVYSDESLVATYYRGEKIE
jgi:hypothetical protein